MNQRLSDNTVELEGYQICATPAFEQLYKELFGQSPGTSMMGFVGCVVKRVYDYLVEDEDGERYGPLPHDDDDTKDIVVAISREDREIFLSVRNDPAYQGPKPDPIVVLLSAKRLALQ